MTASPVPRATGWSSSSGIGSHPTSAHRWPRLPRVQEIVGGIEARLAVNARLIDSFAGDFDDGVLLSASESSIVKLTVTNNAVAMVEDALSLTSNHGLTRANPLERHYRDVLCGRVHTPQDDATRVNAGRLALGI